MEQLKLTYNEIILYIAIANTILGMLLGSFPLITGIFLKNRKLGIYGFIISVIGGAILGVLLSYPIAAVFTWLILKKSSAEVLPNSSVMNETPFETGVKDSNNL